MTKPTPSDRMRLQKFLSDAGVASRRHAEEFILTGRVLVNDEIVDTLPAFVDPQHDRVIVDGVTVQVRPAQYFLVHKPRGAVCTHHDPAGRIRAVDLLPPAQRRLFPVGRLDEDSSGLLLMTNDGELAQQITHPRYGVPKVYRAEVRGRVAEDLPKQLKRGVYLAEGRARASDVKVVRATSSGSILTITLREGRNRQVRRMLARLGHPVRTLKRLQIGPLSLKGLPVGAARALTAAEVKLLRQAVAPAGRTRQATPRPAIKAPGSPRMDVRRRMSRADMGGRGKREAQPRRIGDEKRTRATARRIIT